MGSRYNSGCRSWLLVLDMASPSLTEADLLEQRDVGVSALEGELHRLREGLWMSDYVSFGHYNVMHTYNVFGFSSRISLKSCT